MSGERQVWISRPSVRVLEVIEVRFLRGLGVDNDLGAAPGRRLTSPGIAETFGYEPIPGRLVRPEPEPEPSPVTLRVRAYRARKAAQG